MVKRANANLMSNVKDIWISVLPNDNRHVINHLFNNVLKPHDTILEIQDNRVVSALCKSDGAIMINGRILAVSTILFAGTLPRYQNHRYMDGIMNNLVDNLEHSELVSLATAQNPDLFLKYGFRVLYKKNRYELTRDDVQRITNDGCTFDPSAEDLLRLYATFMQRFNGYRVKTLKDFEKLKKSIDEQGGKIVAYYENDEIKSYGILRIDSKVIHLDECIYSDTLSLFKVLNVALQQRHKVFLNVSSAERLDKLFKNAKCETVDYAMMRLNNRELFNRLYNSNVVSVDEIALNSDKPLYISDLFWAKRVGFWGIFASSLIDTFLIKSYNFIAS